jgi:hypothetical protein
MTNYGNFLVRDVNIKTRFLVEACGYDKKDLYQIGSVEIDRLVKQNGGVKGLKFAPYKKFYSNAGCA